MAQAGEYPSASNDGFLANGICLENGNEQLYSGLQCRAGEKVGQQIESTDKNMEKEQNGDTANRHRHAHQEEGARRNESRAEQLQQQEDNGQSGNGEQNSMQVSYVHGASTRMQSEEQARVLPEVGLRPRITKTTAGTQATATTTIAGKATTPTTTEKAYADSLAVSPHAEISSEGRCEL